MAEYTKKQYARLSKKNKRRAGLGGKDIDTSDLHVWKQQQERKNTFKSVYKNHAGGYR